MTFTFDDLKALREEGFTDDQIGSVLAQEDQSISDVLKEGFTLEQITSTISGQPIPEGFGKQPAEEEGFLRQAADIPVNIFKGGVTGTRMVTDVFGAANPVSKALAGVEDYMDSLLSAEAKRDQQEIARILADAQDKGVLDQVMAGIEAFSVAPADTLANAFGTMIPVLATGLAGSVARLAPITIKGVQLGMGFAQGVGTAKGEIYNAVYSELENQGYDPETASQIANKAQAYNGKNLDQILISGGLGAADAFTGAEKILTNVITKAGGKVTGGAVAKAIKGGITEAVPDNVITKAGGKVSGGAVAKAIKGGITEAVTEGAQGGQEKLATNIALQREGVDVPTMRGVVSQATMEGIAGLGMGAAVGPLAPDAPPTQKPPPPKPPPKPPLPDDVREQRDIERDAEKVARELSVDPNDANARGIVNETNRLEQKIENNKVMLAGLEPTSREHQRLSLEIAEDQKNLAALKGAVDKLSLPITTDEQQQIELAKQIAAPAKKEAKLPAMPSIEEQTSEAAYGRETGVYDVFGGVRRKPAPTVQEGLPVPSETKATVTPATAKQEGAKEINLQEISESVIAAFPDMMEADGGLLPLTRFTPDEQASLRKAGIVETATTSKGETYEGVNAEYLWQRRKQLQQERAAKLKQAPATEPAPVSEPITEPAVVEQEPVAPAPVTTPAPAETPAAPAPAVAEDAAKFADEALRERDKEVGRYKKKAEAERKAGREEMAQRYEGMIDDLMSVPAKEFKKDVIENPAYYIESNVDPFLRFKNKEVNRATAPTPAAPTAEPAGISVGSRVKGKGPQTYIVEEVLPQTEAEKELGEVYYSVKNERTGKVQTVEAKAIKPVKAKKVRKVAAETRVKDESLVVPEAERYTFEQAEAEATKLFGGMPEGFIIVNDSVDPELEFKAGYEPDTGNIILNLAYIRQGESVRNLIAHELGHYAAGDPDIRAKLQEFLDALSPTTRAKLERFVERVYNDETGDIRLEEKQVRAFVQMLKTGDQRNAFQKLIDAIKKWLNDKLGTNFQPTDMDAAAVLSGAINRFVSGEKIAREDGEMRRDTELSQMDAEYLDAVERGDMETAQRMVDEAAKKAGYDLSHRRKIQRDHTSAKNVIQFVSVDSGISNDSYGPVNSMARSSDFGKPGADVIKFTAGYYGVDADEALRLLEPKAIVDDAAAWDDAQFVSDLWQEMESGNVKEQTGFLTPDGAVVIDPSSILVKSADPVTYDDAGNVIPLSQRFRPEKKDIRYAKKEQPEPEKPAEEKPTEPEKPKERGTIARMAITAYKTTPKGILAKTTQIIKDSVFDGDSEVSDSATKRAWNLINSLVATNDKSIANAEAINQLTREAMTEVKAPEGATTEEAKTFDVVKQTVGMPKLRNELFKYAIKLTGQGDRRMLDFLLNNELNLAGSSIKTKEDIGRFLGALRGISSYIITATEAEQAGFFNIAAQQFFDTKNPTDEQVQQIKDIFNKVKEVKIDQEKELMTELEEVGKAAGVDLPAVIQKQIESSPGLDPMVVAITNMLKMGGTFIYRLTKNKIGEAVKNTISRGITNYRKKIVSKAANGLETGFWKTLSSTEQKPGPLGELDAAQNKALGNIVKQSLVAMGLKGTPPDTKMSIYEQVASILNEQPLSQDKIKTADEMIAGKVNADGARVGGSINENKVAELNKAETEEQVAAIEAKYAQILDAWDDAMSRMLDMPVSETMLRRMILNELKESDSSISELATLMDEEPVIGTSRQDRLVNSIIEKIVGSDRYVTWITAEGKPEADYTKLQTYLSNLLENMVLARQQKNKAAKSVAKVRKEATGDPEKQAQAQIDKLAKIQADPTIFGEKKIDPVRNAVRDALALQLNIGFTPEQTAKIKNNWKGAFVADPNKKGIPTSFMLELQRLGVSEAAANTLADIVWRQIEVNAMSRQMDATTKAVEAGPIGGIVQAILDTPLANQQDPEWRKNAILDYLKNAGVKPSQAENIAKLFDVSLRKRFAKAQEEAAIKAAKSIKGGLTPNSKRALEKFLKAIRAQVLDPGKDVAKAFAEEMGWKGFTSEQIVKLNELDAIVNDEERTEAERAVAIEQIQKIIDKVSMPPQIKEVLASFYIGNALMRFTTFAIQKIDPLAMATFNTTIESFRNVTNPQQFIQTWANYGRAVSNLFRETAYSFKNDVLRSGRMIDYLENEDRKNKRLWNEAENKWKRGDIRGAMKDGIFGYTAWTFRTLKALDDGAYSLLTTTTLPQYVEAALKNAKIPREKRLGVMRQVLHAREMDIEQMVSKGIPRNDAVIYANERMQSAITKELSGLNIDAQEVINSAINDALARIGKTRFAEDILTGKTEEIKDLGTISAPFLRWYESVSQAVSGKGSESQKIFYRILLGFPLIPARIFNIAAGYTPLTIYRHALKGRYQLTYGTALQRRQRMAEQLAGTMVLLPLLALRSNSLDEEDEKEKGFGIYITGQGPSKLKDKTLHAKWNDRHDPFSLEFRMGGKTKFAIDAKAAGPLSVMIYLLGAMDDWETNRKLDELKTTKDDWKKAEDNASLLTSLYDLAGYAVLTTARRGPTTGVMQGLVDFRRFPDDPLAAIGADVAFSAMPAVPILGTGIAKNLSDFLSQPIDNTTKEGAILANIPIVGPIAGKPALNSYGQRIGELRVSEKLKKSFGVPFTLVVSDSDEDNKLTSLTLKNGDGPTPLRREDVENAFQEAITDEEWYLAAKTFGDRNKSYVLKNYSRYEKLSPEGFSKAMSKLSRGSKLAAIAAVKNQRQKKP